MFGSYGLCFLIVEFFVIIKWFGFYCFLVKKYIKILIKMLLFFCFWMIWNVCFCIFYKVEVVEVNSKDGGFRVEFCSMY